MRFRRRSIRAKITALLLVPLTALTGLWAYTTVLSVNQVWGLMQISSDYRWFGYPADDLARAMQVERRIAVNYAATPRTRAGVEASPAALAPLRAAQARTDAAAAVFDQHVRDGAHRGDLDLAEQDTVLQIDDTIAALKGERDAIEKHYFDWYSVYIWYSNAQDPFFQLRLQLSDIPGSDLARTAQNLIELTRAREYVSREDALQEGAHVQGKLGPEAYQELLATGSTEQLLFQVHSAQLPAPMAQLYQQFMSGSDYLELNLLEDASQEFGSEDEARKVNYPQWRLTADRVLDQASAVNTQAANMAGAQGQDYATGVIRDDALAGLGGLLAVLLTVLISLRIGRRLVRELVELRDGAFELAGVRLPSVMRRLRDGEKVDVAVEAPPLAPTGAEGQAPSAAHDELSQLSRAFNAVQRAAVEAAVEQAELRRGIAAVFVNLARRSQALLHRQLSLLDEMERRAEEPGELEDLFKLDHLTTRMRRHAEGLIILSGSAPGRSWRRPVRILDVVRAGVGEIEDYARVRIHRMPPVAVVGGAVSDLVHLLAELVENATVFSPPHTQVRIQGEEVANGFVLEIDDRGLGMGEDALAAANDRLAMGGDFDLGDTDRLGLFVVSRLASRHQIRVQLRRSPYGGTTAVVLLPRELLTPAQPRPGDADASGEHVFPAQLTRIPRESLSRDSRPGSGEHRSPAGAPLGVGLGGPRPHAPEEDAATGGLPRRRPQRALPAGPPSQQVLDEDVLAEELLAEEVLEAELLDAEVPGDLPPALPKRVRQASLAPQLRRAEGSAPVTEAAAEPRPERTPEQARATFASFQRGLSRGRADQPYPHRPATTEPSPEESPR